MIGKIRLEIEKRLRNRGIASSDMRRILSGQTLFAFAGLAAGLALLPFSVWPLAFGLGAALATLNLWQLARSVVRAMGQTYAPAVLVAHLCAFLGRFALTGAALYLLLVQLHLPVVPLLAGLSTVAAALAVRGAAGIAGNSFKEI